MGAVADEKLEPDERRFQHDRTYPDGSVPLSAERAEAFAAALLAPWEQMRGVADSTGSSAVPLTRPLRTPIAASPAPDPSGEVRLPSSRGPWVVGASVAALLIGVGGWFFYRGPGLPVRDLGASESPASEVPARTMPERTALPAAEREPEVQRDLQPSRDPTDRPLALAVAASDPGTGPSGGASPTDSAHEPAAPKGETARVAERAAVQAPTEPEVSRTAPPAEATVAIYVRVEPPEAVLRLDGRRVENPLELVVQQGATPRHFEARAEGYRRRAFRLSFDRDVRKVIALAPEQPRPARRPRSRADEPSRPQTPVVGAGFVTENPY